MGTKLSDIRRELIGHLPFSVAASAVGLLLAGLISFFTTGAHGDHDLFHLFHPLHMLFSGAATAAMFRRHDRYHSSPPLRSFLRATLIGLVGAIVVCGISDIAIPHAAVLLLGKSVHLHICVIEEPGLVLPFAFIGVLVGALAADAVKRSTVISHSLHVGISSMASILYIMEAFDGTEWMGSLGMIFPFVIFAVTIPCCLSDILFPMGCCCSAQKDAPV